MSSAELLTEVIKLRQKLSDYSPTYCLAPLVAGALVAGAAAVGSSILNYKSQKDANKLNEKYADKANALTQQEFDYQKQLNNQIMEREDSAYQRAVADARQAGLSPLVVAGTGGAGAGGTVSGFNGSLTSPNIQAPQLETNTFIDMMNQLVSARMQERQMSHQSAMQEDEQTHEEMMQQAEIDAANDSLKTQIAATKSEGDANRLNDMIKFNKQLQFSMDSKNADYAAEMSKEMVQSARQMGCSNIVPCGSMQTAKAHNTAVIAKAQRAFDAELERSQKANQGFDTATLKDSASNSGSFGVGNGSTPLSAGVSNGSGQEAVVGRDAFKRAEAAYRKVLNDEGIYQYIPEIGSGDDSDSYGTSKGYRYSSRHR